MSDYRIAEKKDKNDLEIRVNELLIDGYVPIGGVFIISKESIVSKGILEYIFSQAMYKS